MEVEFYMWYNNYKVIFIIDCLFGKKLKVLDNLLMWIFSDEFLVSFEDDEDLENFEE